MVDTTRVRSHEAHRAGVAPETEARRQRVCAEVVGDSGHVTAPTAAPEQHTVGEPSGSETLRRSAVEDNVSGPSLLLVVRHRSPGNNFIRFSFLKVSFVLCFFVCLIWQTTGRSTEAERIGGRAGLHPAAINCVAMVLRGNIPPAAAACL